MSKPAWEKVNSGGVSRRVYLKNGIPFRPQDPMLSSRRYLAKCTLRSEVLYLGTKFSEGVAATHWTDSLELAASQAGTQEVLVRSKTS